MNIGIDGNEANIKNRVGVNKYAYEMLLGLQKENEKKVNPNNLIVYLKNKPLKDLPRETKYFNYRIISGGGLWILTKLMPYLWKNPEKIDLLYSPSHYVPMFLSIPRICSIMDLDYLNNSEHFEKKVFWQLKYWTAISIFVSKRILTISDSSKKDIVRHYPFASEKITVTHLGYDRDKFNLNMSNDLVRRVKNRYSIVDDYILFVSTLKPSKNVEGLIDAFASISSKYPKLSLVVAGKKGWMFEKIYERVEKLNLTKKIIFTDFIDEKDKPALISGAKIFTLPSFWEGFGLDVLSAFACGVPTVISNVGSLPEVAGEAGIYVDPRNIESIASGMEKVLNMSEKEYNKQVDQGLIQVKKFSWEQCSKKTLEILENA